MSESMFDPNILNENLWGLPPSQEEIIRAESEAAERTETWESSPPIHPAPHLLHPEHPRFEEQSFGDDSDGHMSEDAPLVYTYTEDDKEGVDSLHRYLDSLPGEE